MRLDEMETWEERVREYELEKQSGKAPEGFSLDPLRVLGGAVFLASFIFPVLWVWGHIVGLVMIVISWKRK